MARFVRRDVVLVVGRLWCFQRGRSLSIFVLFKFQARILVFKSKIIYIKFEKNTYKIEKLCGYEHSNSFGIVWDGNHVFAVHENRNTRPCSGEIENKFKTKFF